jgi:hypothetical protein
MAFLFLKKIYNIWLVVYYFCVLTTKWSLLAFFCGCRESFYAGSLQGMRDIGIQIGLTGFYSLLY